MIFIEKLASFESHFIQRKKDSTSNLFPKENQTICIVPDFPFQHILKFLSFPMPFAYFYFYWKKQRWNLLTFIALLFPLSKAFRRRLSISIFPDIFIASIHWSSSLWWWWGDWWITHIKRSTPMKFLSGKKNNNLDTAHVYC